MADRKISEMSALAAGEQATDDLIAVVDVDQVAAADKNKKMTMEALFQGIPGNVGIGTSAPDDLLHLSADNTLVGSDWSLAKNLIRIEDKDTSQAIGQVSGGIVFEGNDSNAGAAGVQAVITANANSSSGGGQLRFYTAATNTTLSGSEDPRLIIDGDGNVGIGITTVPTGLLLGNSLTVASSTGAEIVAFRDDNTTEIGDACGAILIGNSDSGGTEDHFCGMWAKGASTSGAMDLHFAARRSNYESDIPHLTILNAGGNVGIGTTNPGSLLEVLSSGSGAETIAGFGNSLITNGLSIDTNGNLDWGFNARNSRNLTFSTNQTERARIDSSGRLLVGTTTSYNAPSTTGTQYDSFNQTHAATAGRGSQLIAEWSTSTANGGGSLKLAKSNSGTVGTHTALAVNQDIGSIVFAASDGTNFINAAHILAEVDGTTGTDDMPGRLVFSTTADGASTPTERMRISNDGSVDIGPNNGTQPSSTVRGFRVKYDAHTLISRNVNDTGVVVAVWGTLGEARIKGDGDLENTNNSYGAISDAKLKENVVDSNTQWDDLKALQIRKYNFKAETGYGTHTQIGLVAQEVELVSPGLVSESPDLDEDGNDLGTVTKSVNYSVLYMKAVKALQEAMARIETLEAKVAALEAG